MHMVILRGHDAINYARDHSIERVNQFIDNQGRESRAVALDAAEQASEQTPELIWLEVPATVHSAD